MFKRRDFRWVERNRLVSSSNFFFFFSFFLHVECVEYEMFFYCSIFIIVFLFVSLFRLASPFCDQSSRWRRPGSSRIVVQVTPERLTIAAAFQFAASNACTELGKKKEEKLSYNNNSTKFDYLLYRLDFHSFPFYLVFLLLFCVLLFDDDHRKTTAWDRTTANASQVMAVRHATLVCYPRFSLAVFFYLI